MDVTENYRSITIANALRNIDSGNFLLPAIQRKFVWQKEQIEDLFDSLLQGYPINTMMVWNVTAPEVKRDFQFYRFLDRYCEWFHDENPKVATIGFPDFGAVIDGQQRLTSIYIGFKGSYALKRKNKHWPKTEDLNVFPRERLCVDLKSPNTDDGDSRKYILRFISDGVFQADVAAKTHHWFRMEEVLSYQKVDLTSFLIDDVPGILDRLNLSGTESERFARETLCKLWDLVWRTPTIHYYQESDQDIDRVLNVFIRTNNGGTKLSMSSLLMSVAIAKWNDDENRTDPRTEIEKLVKDVWQDAAMSFQIDQDWVLKTCLFLTDADIKFKVKNFTKDCVETIQHNWPNIRDAIRATFEFLNKMGVKDRSLPAKNAVIPLVYYLYKKPYRDGSPLFKVIARMKPDLQEEQRLMVKWLNIVTLKRTFGSQSDNILSAMRKILSDNMAQACFPLKAIVDHFKGKGKDLRFNIDEINLQLGLHKDNPMCRSLLMILFPEINVNFNFDIDHLHPRDSFGIENLKKCAFLQGNQEKLAFYKNWENWDTVPNLHLLNDSMNRSKQDRPLKDWIEDPTTGFTREGLLIPTNVDLSFEKFPEFLSARKEMLKQRFAEAVEMVAEGEAAEQD